ncbi:MAG: fumarate hydratase C-terminal domain-containing protein [Hyphomicrobiales bacterium]|nr:fumarate hydratase C-terminal domain-containing protein [Hyphomicrobiales bacterium]
MSGENLHRVRLSLPATTEDLAQLKPGTIVFLDGVVYTGREGVYKKVLEQGAELPVDLASLGNANFHCSPAAARNDDGTYTVGAVTATASFRFSRWMPDWFKTSGARVVIGKGGMPAEDYRKTFVPAGAVYLTTVGYGTGALLGRGITRVRDVFWLDELGIAQAMWVLEVANFGPFIVDSDLEGNSLFEQANAEINAKLEHAYDGLRQPALRRYGETKTRTDEVI